MLKYLKTQELFREVPGEISLGISISGCMIHCPKCHSKELWEDKGTPLTKEELHRLSIKHRGVTCMLFLGGEHNVEALTELFEYTHTKLGLRVAWYCGLDMVPKTKNGVKKWLDFLKIGHYDEECGPLNSPTTNQRLYKLDHNSDGTYWESDITYLLQKQNNENKSTD